MASASTAEAPPTSRIPRPGWVWARVLGGIAILSLLVWQVGTGPFLDGVRLISGSALFAAFGLGVLTTVCCAWRWSLVAAGLGVRLPLPAAVAAYYRSQFLNSTLPGGVIGDVHRAVRHGLDIGNVGLAARAVVLERVAGQTVQAAIAIAVLLAFASPVRSALPVALAVTAGGILILVVLARTAGRGRSNRVVRLLRAVATDIRAALFSGRNLVGIVASSAVVVAGHLTTFIIAARTAGATAPLSVLVPLTLLALLAMAVPLNVAGWGPREGMAAWAFGAAGLTATQGVATAVTYGVLAFVASLPGAGVLVYRWLNRGGARG